MALALFVSLHAAATLAQAVKPGESAVSLHGARGGFAVYIGQSHEVVSEFGKHDNYSLHVLSRDRAFVAEVRKRLKKAGRYGASSAEYWSGGELPYVENMVSLLILEDPAAVVKAEALRCLSPGGLALLGKPATWKKLRKPLAVNTDDWTQYLYDAGNNAVSRDTVVAPPRCLQWRGSPRWGRFHEKMSSFAAMVAKDGRIFYIMDEGSPASIFFPSKWSLTARDAYNGTVLWKRPINKWVSRLFPYKAGPSTAPRRLVAGKDGIYVTLGIDAAISKLDPKTGKTLKTYADTDKADEIVLAGDLLLVVVRDQLEIPSTRTKVPFPGVGLSRGFWAKDQKAWLKAIDPSSGSVRWKVRTPIAPLCTGADGKRVYTSDYKSVIALDRETGKTLWTTSDVEFAANYPSGYAPRLVISDGVVLFAGSKNSQKHRGSWKTPSDRLVAISAKTGKRLWDADHPASGFLSPEDIFVIKGAVWFGATKDGNQKGPFHGIDLHTGKEISTFVPDNTSYWFHQRCHLQKATDNYILTSRTGIEFVDPAAKHWELNHWVRGACVYGVMPANGLTYAPAHPCACYPESKLSGMNAMAARQRHSLNAAKKTERLHKGPAYEAEIPDAEASSEDWPLYRRNPDRSSYAPTKLSGTPALSWKTSPGGVLTSPIAAQGMIFAAQKEAHTVFAVSAKDGAPKWSFTAGGRVDSPPAYALGRIVFGSRDGYVYCLNAHDGALRWRFLAARRDKRISNFEQLESVWPVFGSVLVLDKSVFLTAGRSVFLDEGITFFRLDLETGKPISTRQWNSKAPDGTDYHKLVSTLQKDAKLSLRSLGLTMPAANNDLLSARGANLFMASQMLTMDGKRVMAKAGARNEGNERSHVFSPTGLLDDTWWHRSYQAYGNAVEGGYAWYVSLHKVINGKILCADKDAVYGFGRKARFRRWTVPLECELFSEPIKPKMSKPTGPAAKRPRRLPVKANWSLDVPVWVRTMFVTDNTLVVCGPRDLYDEEKAVTRGSSLHTTDPLLALQQEHAEGKHGSILKVFDKKTGKEISSIEIDDMSAWEGMITARGNIFMTTVNGRILCFKLQ